MPLSMVNAGEPFTIKRIGGKEEVKRHLEELGFVVGGVVTVVSEINGSLIVNVKFQSCHWKRYGKQDYGLNHNFFLKEK